MYSGVFRCIHIQSKTIFSFNGPKKLLLIIAPSLSWKLAVAQKIHSVISLYIILFGVCSAFAVECENCYYDGFPFMMYTKKTQKMAAKKLLFGILRADKIYLQKLYDFFSELLVRHINEKLWMKNDSS